MFSSADFAGPMRAVRNMMIVIVIICLITVGAFWKRLSVQAHNEWVARCIIANVDYRPPEGLRAYCENQYYKAKDAGSAP